MAQIISTSQTTALGTGTPTTTAIGKSEMTYNGDVEALDEIARPVDEHLNARVLRKIDWVLMPAMIIGKFW